MEERSIYLISSISRLIFSPGLTKRDGKESERGREGEADRDRPERKKERKERVRRSDRPTKFLGAAADAPFPPPSSLPSFSPPRSFLFRPLSLPTFFRRHRRRMWHPERRCVAHRAVGRSVLSGNLSPFKAPNIARTSSTLCAYVRRSVAGWVGVRRLCPREGCRRPCPSVSLSAARSRRPDGLVGGLSNVHRPTDRPRPTSTATGRESSAVDRMRCADRLLAHSPLPSFGSDDGMDGSGMNVRSLAI